MILASTVRPKSVKSSMVILGSGLFLILGKFRS
ncbi:hypothetical protein CsSME_00040318 [Camellia sinensis var. sinensis]